MLQKQSLFYKMTTFTMSLFQGVFKGSVKTSNNGSQVRRDAKIGSNRQGEGLESRLPRRNREGRIGGFILYRILMLSFEDSAPIKLFFSVR